MIEYHRLWGGVLSHGLSDAAAGDRAALSWLRSKDFVQVCYHAGLEEPELLQRMLLQDPTLIAKCARATKYGIRGRALTEKEKEAAA